MTMQDLISKYLVLAADSPTGLRWKIEHSKRAPAGAVAINGKTGRYATGSIQGRSVSAHRAVHYLATGEWPPMVDHRNGNTRDNVPSNLRSSDQQQNQHNRKGRGYCWDKRVGRWLASISLDGRSRFLGHYDTPEEARSAYLQAKAVLHPAAQPHLFEDLK